MRRHWPLMKTMAPCIATACVATIALVAIAYYGFHGYPGQTYPVILATVAAISWRCGPVTAGATLGTTAVGLAYFVLEGEGVAIAKPEQAMGLAIMLSVGSATIWSVRSARRGRDGMAARIESMERAAEMRDGQYAEIVHRIRNDLGALAAVMSIYGRNSSDPQAATRAMSERIAVLSRLYQRLHMPDKEGADVEMESFLNEVVQDLRATHLGMRPISIEAHVEEASLPLRTASVVGLTVNEAVANAIKYAFPEDRVGTIQAHLSRVPDNMMRLEIRDDGVGPDGGKPKGTGMGTRLLRAMAAQIGGTYSMQRVGDETVVTVLFPAT